MLKISHPQSTTTFLLRFRIYRYLDCCFLFVLKLRATQLNSDRLLTMHIITLAFVITNFFVQISWINYLAASVKIQLIQLPVLADVSQYGILRLLARSWAIYLFTILLSGRSVLFPTKIILICSLALIQISYNHF